VSTSKYLPTFRKRLLRFFCQYSDPIIECFALLPEDSFLPSVSKRSVQNICVVFGSLGEVQTMISDVHICSLTVNCLCTDSLYQKSVRLWVRMSPGSHCCCRVSCLKSCGGDLSRFCCRERSSQCTWYSCT